MVFIDIFWEIALRIPQADVWFALMFFKVDWLVEIVVDDVIFLRLLTDVIMGWWHTNQMYLVESEPFRANPRMTLAILAVMEHFAVNSVISVVSVGGGLWFD